MPGREFLGDPEDLADAAAEDGCDCAAEGRWGEAAEFFDRALELVCGADSAYARELTARTLTNKAVALRELGRSEGQIECLDDVVARFGDSDNSDLRQEVARALNCKKEALDDVGRHAEALFVAQQIVARFDDDPTPGLQQYLAIALVRQASALFDEGRSLDALAAYESVIDRFRNELEDGVRGPVVEALIGEARVLAWNGAESDVDEAINKYDEAIELCDEDSDELLIWAQRDKAGTLQSAGRHREALVAVESSLMRIASAADPPDSPRLASLSLRAEILQSLGDYRAAIASYDDVVGRIHDADDPTLKDELAYAQLGKGQCLMDLRRWSKALPCLDSAIEISSDLSDDRLAAESMWNKVISLAHMGENEKGLEICDTLIARFGRENAEDLWFYIAHAMHERARLLAVAGREQHALAECDRLISSYGSSSDDAVRDVVLSAKRLRMGIGR